MEQAAFEAKLHEQGYLDIVDRQMPANAINPSHVHDFDAHLLIVSGVFTLVRDSGAQTYTSGETFELPAGTVHEERAGPDGARYIAGRRHKN